jgi:hypothetical protein
LRVRWCSVWTTEAARAGVTALAADTAAEIGDVAATAAVLARDGVRFSAARVWALPGLPWYVWIL